METQQTSLPKRTSPHYTARHRHHLSGRGYTTWSDGVADGRHGHAFDDGEPAGFIADCVGSPVHRHAWNVSTVRRIERGYTSGPLLERALVPAMSWISRVLRR